MKINISSFTSGILFGFGVLLTTFIGIGAYAAYSNLTVITGETLSTNKWNELITYTVPPGAVIAFYGTNCPANWSPADGTVNGVKKTDGTSGTLDLRGEFIRGLDTAGVGSRGVDAARTLASAQNASRAMYGGGNPSPIYLFGGGNYGISVAGGSTVLDLGPSYLENISTTATHYGSTSSWLAGFNSYINSSSTTQNYGTVRPRNVALLYCVKN